MKLRLNTNKEIVKEIKERLKDNGGYCPCRLIKNKDTKCMCKEFRELLEDTNFIGTCHCGLYEVYER